MKTAIVYHFFAHYRAAVLTSLMNASDREFVLVGARADPWGGIKAWDIPEGIPFREAPSITLGRHVLLQRKLLPIALSREFDSIILLGDAGWPATWLAALLARLSGKQVYFWTHGYPRYDVGLKRLVRRAFYKIPHGLLLYGHMAKMVAIGEGFDPARLHVIYNSLDYDAQRTARESMSPDRLRARRASLFTDPNPPIVICTSRLTHAKRLDTLIDAAALLKASGSPVNVLLVGDGPERATLEERARSRGVDVQFFGACYDEDTLSELIMAADLTVVPDAAGLTVIHSLAFGTPVVTHDVWDHQGPEWEAVIDGKTGGFFQKGDVVSLSQAIGRWTDGSQPRDRIPRECISIVERFYSPAHQTRCILRALEGYPADDLLSTKEAHQKSLAPTARLVVISNGITPYGVHFLRRVAAELTGFRLRTIYSCQFSMGRWDISPPADIDATIFGKGEVWAVPQGITALCRDWMRGRELVRTVREARPRAVMIYGYSSLAHWMAIDWCARKKIPCLLWADSNIRGDRATGARRLLKTALLRRLVPKLSKVLVCGRLGREYYVRYGARREDIFYVPNEPDYALIESLDDSYLDEVAGHYNIDRRRKRLLFVGRLVRLKRIDSLIQAFTSIAEQRPNWDLLIVGHGPELGPLREGLPDGLRERVVWTGFLADQRRVGACYRLSDVLVLPSEYDAWALVVNEAACAGLSLVCSDVVGAAAELLRDGENGRVFPVGDLHALENALLDVTDERNLDRYKAMSRKILAEWRQAADPVRGLERALLSCPSLDHSSGRPRMPSAAAGIL